MRVWLCQRRRTLLTIFLAMVGCVFILTSLSARSTAQGSDLGLVVWVRGLGDNPSPLVASSGPSVRLRRPPVLDEAARSRRADRVISTLDTESKPVFSVSLNQTALYWHGRYARSMLQSPTAGREKPRCFAVCVVGLARTLVWPRVHKAMRRNLLAPMGQCVDVYWVVSRGQGEQRGHRPGIAYGIDMETDFEDMRGALVDMAPVFVTEGGVGGWRPKFSNCMKQARRVEADVNAQLGVNDVAEYEWVFRVRTDFLFLRPIDLARFSNKPRTHRHYKENNMDFFQALSVPPAAVFKGKRTPYHKSFPRVDARICRPKSMAQRVLDGFDILWQNVLPLAPDPPAWVRSAVPPNVMPNREFRADPRRRADLLFRAMTVFCHRLDLLTRDGIAAAFPMDGARCDLRADHCAQGNEWKFSNHHLKFRQTNPEGRCTAGGSLLRALRELGAQPPYDERNNVARLQAVIDYLYHVAEFLVENFGDNEQMRSLRCTCHDWRTEWSQQGRPGPAERAQYYDHTSLECNDTVSEAKAKETRALFQREAIAAFVQNVRGATAGGEAVQKEDSGQDADEVSGRERDEANVHQGYGDDSQLFDKSSEDRPSSENLRGEDDNILTEENEQMETDRVAPPRARPNVTISRPWARIYAELTLLCDIYRYQMDFLGDDSVSLSTVASALASAASAMGTRGITRHAQSLPMAGLLAAVRFAQTIEQDGGGVREEQATKVYKGICAGVVLFDGFRCRADSNL